MNTYRSIDNDWDLDEFYCNANGRLYHNNKLKAKLVWDIGGRYMHDDILVKNDLFPCYGAGFYRMEQTLHVAGNEVDTTTVIKIGEDGDILINSWRCGDTINFYFKQTMLEQMSYDFESKLLWVNYNVNDSVYNALYWPDKTITTGGETIDRATFLKEQFADCFLDLCEEIGMEEEIELIKVNLRES